MKFNSLHTVLVSCALALGFTVTACDDEGGSKDVCEQAADVVDDCNLPDDSSGESGGEDAACEGEVEASAQCIVDFPDQTCAFFENPLDEGSADLLECLTAANGG